MEMAKSNVVTGQNSSICTMGVKRIGPVLPEDHRCLSSTLYMAKPSTANTVAPTLALSQKVELFRSAWFTCLFNREKQTQETLRDGVTGYN